MAEFVFDETVPLLVEVTPGAGTVLDDDSGIEESLRVGGGAGAVVRQASDAAVRQAFSTIYAMARRTGHMMSALQQHEDQASLDNVEIEFGLMFNGDVNAYIAKAGAEATINVKIGWKPGVQREP